MTIGMKRLDSDKVVSLRIDMNMLKLEVTLRGGSSTADIPRIPAECAVAVCFGGKSQRVRLASCILLPDPAVTATAEDKLAAVEVDDKWANVSS